MNVSYNWLQEYVNIPWPAVELAERLTMAGMEVEETSAANPGLDGIVVGEIIAVNEHPNADGLSICLVSTGSETLTIVAGAPNVRVGLRVPVATIGTMLPNGLKIEGVELRGVQSSGMMCSEKELGLGDDHSGIMELPGDAPVGESFVAALQLDDTILDVSIYANRPDCMSMLGMGREVAALQGATITYPAISLQESAAKVKDLLTLRVEDHDLCPRYMARVIQDIKVGPSPLWIQAKLRAAGMRPINNVVDITNFVMLEMGQPLHAFDYDTLAGSAIVVRRPRAGETLVTLDEQERRLEEDMLLICDAEKPVCIGGVMGGGNSEVTETTTTLVLEAANFQAASIRRTSRRLGIASEAASRFEKGLSPHGTEMAMERAAQLLQLYAQGQPAQGVLDAHRGLPEPRTIQLRYAEIRRLLGIDIPASSVKACLQALEFAVVAETEQDLLLSVPPFRTDVELECDVIEEAIRHYGYDRIPRTLPTSGANPGGQTKQHEAVDRIRHQLAGFGLQEALNYTFIHRGSVQRMGYGRQEFPGIPLHNPISEDQAVMRPSLLPGLLDALARNFSRQQTAVSLFELGAVYLTEESQLTQHPREELRVALAMMGQAHDDHWSVQPRQVDFYDIKGVVERVLAGFDLPGLTWQRSQAAWVHPGRSAEVVWNQRPLVVLGQLHPAVAQNLRLPKETMAAEMDLQAMLERYGRVPQIQPLPRFPGVERDLALLVSDDTAVGQLLADLKQVGGETLVDAWVFDVYQGEQVPEGCKSAAFGFRFQAKRNLTDDEVQAAMDLILQYAQKHYDAQIR